MLDDFMMRATLAGIGVACAAVRIVAIGAAGFALGDGVA